VCYDQNTAHIGTDSRGLLWKGIVRSMDKTSIHKHARLTMDKTSIHKHARLTMDKTSIHKHARLTIEIEVDGLVSASSDIDARRNTPSA
jgi:hypothetical protein